MQLQDRRQAPAVLGAISQASRGRSPLALSRIAIVLALLSACTGRQRPNVLLISIDTLRADHLGCYGFGLAHTPAIDRLAREGVRCTDVTS